MMPGRLALAGLMLPIVAACSPTPTPSTTSRMSDAVATSPPAPAAVQGVADSHATSASALPVALVHKSPTCGCCTAWVQHLRQAGFRVEIDEREDLEPLKKQLGVPLGKGSCHTAEIGGLVIEGHVPAEDIKRLLAARDDARGLVVPGMPMGSPGMETPDGAVQRYTVERINADGSTVPFATHGK